VAVDPGLLSPGSVFSFNPFLFSKLPSAAAGWGESLFPYFPLLRGTPPLAEVSGLAAVRSVGPLSFSFPLAGDA